MDLIMRLGDSPFYDAVCIFCSLLMAACAAAYFIYLQLSDS